MPEWNQSPGGSPPALDDILEKIRLKLEGVKGAPFLILGSSISCNGGQKHIGKET